MQKQQDAVRTALAESAEAAKKLDRRRRDARQGARGRQGRGGEGHRRGQAGLRAHRSAADRAGWCRRRAHQGPRRATGSVACASSSSDSCARGSATSRSRRPTNSCAPTSPTPPRKSATVDRFLDELDEMAPSDAVVETGASAPPACRQPRGARRAGQRVRRRRGRSQTPGLTTLADELASVVTLLIDEPALTKHLAEPTDDPTAKVRLVDRLLSDKVGEHAAKLLRTAVSQRWSTESDLVDGIEHIGPAGAAEARRGRRPGRRGRGSAVPLRSRARRRAAAIRCCSATTPLQRTAESHCWTRSSSGSRYRRHRRCAAVADHRPASGRTRRRGRPRPGRARRGASR